MAILDSVPDIIAATVGELLLKPASLITISGKGRGVDGRINHTTEAVDIRALVTSYSEFMHSSGGIPDSERKITIQAKGLAAAPVAENVVEIEGAFWKIVKVVRDPSAAVYTCRAAPIEDPSNE